MIMGIDYGARYSGKTVICYDDSDQLLLRRVDKKADADAFVRQHVLHHHPRLIAIDAPLSLPTAYHGHGDDYMYRKCDRACQAMSPMFLGGLTARAMSLRAQLLQYEFIETYPSMHYREAFPGVKKDNKVFSAARDHFLPLMHFKMDISPIDWHELDATLAWYSGWRYNQDAHICHGDDAEGLIII